MKYIALSCFVLLVSTSLSGMDLLKKEVLLPDQAELARRIDESVCVIGFDEAMELSHKLTSFVPSVAGVGYLVKASIAEYNRCIDASAETEEKKDNVKKLMCTRESALIEAILRDQPDILKVLREKRLI